MCGAATCVARLWLLCIACCADVPVLAHCGRALLWLFCIACCADVPVLAVAVRCCGYVYVIGATRHGIAVALPLSPITVKAGTPERRPRLSPAAPILLLLKLFLKRADAATATGSRRTQAHHQQGGMCVIRATPLCQAANAFVRAGTSVFFGSALRAAELPDTCQQARRPMAALHPIATRPLMLPSNTQHVQLMLRRISHL